MSNILTLKWGTVKGWELETDEAKEALQKWVDFGMSMSIATQKDTPKQRDALIAAIDHMDEIWNDRGGVQMTKEEAKDYVLNYGKNK